MKLFFKKISIYLLKYLLLFLSFLTIVFYYFTNTYVGNIHLSSILSNYLSKKSQNIVDIYYLNFDYYPKIEAKMRLNKRINLTVKGHINRDSFLDNESTFEGRADIDTNGSAIGKIDFFNGVYNRNREALFCEYNLSIYDLSYFKKELRGEYSGEVRAKGRLSYRDMLKIDGDTDKFGGNLHFYYDKNDVELKLENISFINLLKAYNYPIFLTAKVFGKIEYNQANKAISFDTKFRETKFFRTEITDKLLEKAEINLLNGLYDKSSFKGIYQHSILSALLKVVNRHEHIYLKNIIINYDTYRIHSKFDIDMQGKEIFGDISGTVDNPKVSVDVSRILMHKMGKGFGGFFF